MATITKPFNSYYFSIYTNYSAEARVMLDQNGVGVGKIDFVKDGTPLPDNTIINNVVCLNYPVSRFNDIITTLRKEKVLNIFCDPATKFGGLGIPNISGVPVGSE